MWRNLKARIPFKKTIYSFCILSAVFSCVAFLIQRNHNNGRGGLAQYSGASTVPSTITKDEDYFPEYHDTPETKTEIETKKIIPPVRHFAMRPAGYAGKVKVKVPIKDPRVRPWNMSLAYEDPGMTTYMVSPYNWANRKGSVSMKPHKPSVLPLLISWQASETLQLRENPEAMFQNCPVRHCTVTLSSTPVTQAVAIVYDDGNIAKQSPPSLRDDRVLIYHSMRTPNDIVTRKTKEDFFDEDWKSVFNWVWSYRLDSEIFEPFAYIRRVNILPQPARLQRFFSLIKAKTHLAVWINPRYNRFKPDASKGDRNVHRGKSHTGLEPYMKAFRKVAPLEEIGVADLKAAMQPRDVSFHLFTYYFVFAFEWTDCAGYVSDLFFDVFDLRVLAVPVVRGSFNYSRHFPKGTFVDADDFESPGELAEYLMDLASRKKAYAEMLWKKLQYVRENALPSAWCQLCDMVHRARDDKNLRKRIDNIYAWSQEGGGCEIVNKTVRDILKAERMALEQKAVTQSGNISDPTEIQAAAETAEQKVVLEEEGFAQEREEKVEETLAAEEGYLWQEKEDTVIEDVVSIEVEDETEDGTERENGEYRIDESAEEEE